MTTFRWYLLGVLLLFGGYVALEYYRPKPINWATTLSNKDKIPYGTYVLYDALPQLLGTDSVQAVRLPIYNQLLGTEEPELNRPEIDTSSEASETQASTDTAAVAPATDSTSTTRNADGTFTTTTRNADSTTTTTTVADEEDDEDDTAGLTIAQTETARLPLTTARASYIFIDNYFDASRLETTALLRFVAEGHDVFIAAENFGPEQRGYLADTLGISTYNADTTRHQLVLQPGQANLSDSVALHLLRPRAGLAASSFWLGTAAADHRIALAAKRTHRGATLAADAQGRPVLVRLEHGRGHFYLCSTPLAFGNYWLLKPRTADFAFAALSYLPVGRPVWWDEYQKQGRTGEQSVLRVIIGSPALRTAYYLLLLSGLLFVLVEARRRQRIIPTLKPLPNTTLLFTRTVAGLYQQGRNHAQIAEKKVALFLDYLRNRFQEATPDLADDSFRERLSQKAGLPRPRIDELVRLINFARTAPVVTDRELLILSRAIRDFKEESR